jgi:hypothetical protein
VFGEKRVFFGDTGRMTADFSFIFNHFSRNELTQTDHLFHFRFLEMLDIAKFYEKKIETDIKQS